MPQRAAAGRLADNARIVAEANKAGHAEDLSVIQHYIHGQVLALKGIAHDLVNLRLGVHHHQLFLGQQGEGDPFQLSQRMIWMQHDTDLRLADGDDLQAGAVRSIWDGVVGQIQLFLVNHPQELLHRTLLQVDLCLGVLVQKVGEDGGRSRIHEGVGHTQPQMLFCGIREVMHGSLSLLAETQDLPNPQDELLPFVGEDHVLGAALDELYAQLRFQGVDGGGDGRLRDKKGISSLGEVLILIDSVEILQMFEV